MINTWADLQKAMKDELNNILNFWKHNTLDTLNGGYIGHIDYPDIKRPEHHKGIILNTRLLWTFSAASIFYKNDKYTDLCTRSYEYLKKYFIDHNYGGVIWEVDYKGNPVNNRKQIYAQAFMIYALSEYYQFSKNEESKTLAITLFDLIEKYALDPKHGGYIEAFNQDWSPITDMRLSSKDKNVEKTMNTHLHLLEAYTKLYQIHPKKNIGVALKNLIHLFLTKFITKNNHLHLFFDVKWNLKSTIYSYGHDIETTWLLIKAAKTLNEKNIIHIIERMALQITDTFLNEAIANDGGVINEINYKSREIDTDRHWWQQAEAIVGLYYAYQIKQDENYLKKAIQIWNFITTKVIDYKHGEWHWLIDSDGNFDKKNEKIGMWKCPYHNSRACIEINKKLVLV